MEFQDFLDAVTEQPAHSQTNTRSFERVTVLGGGCDARLLAALCLAEGVSVRLFSAYAAERSAIANGIALNGQGPIGRYHVQSDTGNSSQDSTSASQSILTTGSLDTCLVDADLIFLSGPIHKQRTYAMVLAEHLVDGQVLVVPNGRTFGAIEVASLLKVGGCSATVSIVELQGLPYWTAIENNGITLHPRKQLHAACLPANQSHDVLGSLARLIPNLAPLTSVLYSSMHDSSALVDIPALILGGAALSSGGPDIPMGGTPLAENSSFFNLLGNEQLHIAEQLHKERRAVASRLGVRDLPAFNDVLLSQAGDPSGDARRFVPTQAVATSLIRDGVLGSFTPLLDTARAVGINLPVTEAMVTLCSTILGSDVSASGRKLANLGIGADWPGSGRITSAGSSAHPSIANARIADRSTTELSGANWPTQDRQHSSGSATDRPDDVFAALSAIAKAGY